MLRLLKTFALRRLRRGACRCPAMAQTKWNLPAAYPADNPHSVNLDRVRQGRWRRDRRQAADHRACRAPRCSRRRRSSARCNRPGADRRGADLAPRERGPDLRHRRGAVPGDELSGREEALAGVEARDREEARLAGPDAAVRGAVGAAGHLRQEGPQHRRGHEGPEVARLQCRHRAHRRTRRRAARDHPGGRTAAGARDRRGQRVHDVGRDRLRQQGLGDADALLRHAGLDPEERHLREQGGVRRARQADAGRDPEGRGGRRGARLEARGRKGQLVPRPAQGQEDEGAAAAAGAEDRPREDRRAAHGRLARRRPAPTARR